MNSFIHLIHVLWIGNDVPAAMPVAGDALGEAHEIRFEPVADIHAALARIGRDRWDATVVDAADLPGTPVKWLRMLSEADAAGELIVRIEDDTPLPTVVEWINGVQGMRLLMNPIDPSALSTLLGRVMAWRIDAGEDAELAMPWFSMELARLTRQATTDNLTGLLRREEMTARTNEEIDRARRTHQSLICIMCDIDHFKRVNDDLGHQAGDRALQSVARLLGSDRRAYDLIGRMGGEEFMLIMPGPTLEEGAQIAERLRHKIEDYQWSSESLPNLTISFGVAELTEGRYANMNELAAAADAALYKAKHSGRNQVCRAEAHESVAVAEKNG